MNRITLQFPSVKEMSDFKAVVTVTIIYSNTTKLTLTGNFTEADIELAKGGFGAVVLDTAAL
jgi:hypothetical protein